MTGVPTCRGQATSPATVHEPATQVDGAGLRFSVVMPSLNSGRFIGAAIQSAIAQEPAPHEVIIQDGGSTDDTLEVVAGFGKAVSLRSEPDGGQADAINRAIARSSGDILVWLNADDLLAPGAFAAVDAGLREHPESDFAYGDFDVINADGIVVRRFRSSAYDPRRVFVHGCYIFSGAMFCRRRLIERVGPYDAGLQACMDFDYLVRIGEARARAVHVGSTVALFRMSAQQKSATMRSTFLRESHRIRWRVAGRSARMRLLTLLLDARDSAYLLTHRFRYSGFWSKVRGNRRL